MLPHGKKSFELIVVCLPDQSFRLEWLEIAHQINKDQEILQNEIFKNYRDEPGSFLFSLGFVNLSTPLSASLGMLRNFARLFIKNLSQTPDLKNLREKADLFFPAEEIVEFMENVPFMVGSEYITILFFESLWDTITSSFRRKIKSFKGTVEEFLKKFSTDIHLAGRVYFHLVESKNDDFPFAFLATYSIRLNEQGKTKHIPLKHALSEYHNDSAKLLDLMSAVYLAARESKIITGLIENGEIFHPIALSSSDAYNILKEIPMYEKYGIICRIPDWWKNKTGNVRLNVKVGNDSPSFLGKDAILDFNLEIICGDQTITEDEVNKLLSESEGLAFIKGKWVEVDREKLKETLVAFKKAQELMKRNGGITLKEAMYLQLHSNKNLDFAGEDSPGISNGEWLKNVTEKLRNPELLQSVSLPKNFTGVLRPYQQKGVNWLSFLHSLQFGACLADDMGLGKTVQLIAFLSILKERKKNPASLLIIPASLISNWANEIHRFSPDFKYYIAHPSYNGNKEINTSVIDGYDLIITTYSLSQKYEWLIKYKWNYIILDEAQAIKNPGTKQTNAVKKLEANNKIIMTGTPVENRIGDLWSLFDFLNPGLLGNREEFSAFSKSLKDNTRGFSKLRKITSPYILRRLKTDKSVISDLPEKVEMKTYSELSHRQIILYGDLVKELKKILEEETEGIRRKGIILSSLMKFKQICNHPDQYLGASEFNETESGKFTRLREICETIFEKREKVLVFTQFKEITSHLQNFLSTIFQHEGLVFHGSINVKKRKEIVEKFQGKDYIPFMVLSLKAGGTGLNLTAANHVVHFDRWWNPAVENQATDRVFRIGQKRNVIVHKFITKGTVEEKIDSMLELKGHLSTEIVQSSNDGWITEMDNEKLMNLLTLSI